MAVVRSRVGQQRSGPVVGEPHAPELVQRERPQVPARPDLAEHQWRPEVDQDGERHDGEQGCQDDQRERRCRRCRRSGGSARSCLAARPRSAAALPAAAARDRSHRGDSRPADHGAPAPPRGRRAFPGSARGGRRRRSPAAAMCPPAARSMRMRSRSRTARARAPGRCTGQPGRRHRRRSRPRAARTRGADCTAWMNTEVIGLQPYISTGARASARRQGGSGRPARPCMDR